MEAMMDDKLQAVKDFVVNVLGCKCPEEVFRDIRLDNVPEPAAGIPLLFEIRVGGRLLIYGVAAEQLGGNEAALAALAGAGRKTRDENGFNRFRLVVVTVDDFDGATLSRQWAELSCLDGRIHLHVVPDREIRVFIDA